MGGDHGPSATLPGCRAFLASHPAAELLLVGTAAALAPAAGWERCRSVVATEVVSMDDPIEVAMRRKKDSSLRVAINQVKLPEEGDAPAHACVSAGNTGALMAVARYLLKTVEGIDRPAIAALLPNQKGRFTQVLDLGANVDCTAEHLLQFGVMGAMLVAAVEHKEQPIVGLLNIGVEDIKGNETVKRAAELLRASGLNFIGNVEGDDIFKGTCDVVVCDGFVGNAILKAVEGVLQMMSRNLKEEFARTALTRLSALAAMPVLRAFRARMDHRR